MKSCEIWREILGYEGDYEVSSFGRVKSLKYSKERILRQEALTGGYMYVFLCKENKVRSFRVHRLVATAFLPNPDGLPEVNHKDENVKNNCVDNLEWATPQYNKIYGTRLSRISQAKKRFILQINPKNNEVIASFLGGEDAAKAVGLKSPSDIYGCCRGVKNTAGGYVWRWADA